MRKTLCVAVFLLGVLAVSAHAEPFFAQRVLQGVTFQVESPNDSSINQVTVRCLLYTSDAADDLLQV